MNILIRPVGFLSGELFLIVVAFLQDMGKQLLYSSHKTMDR